MRYKKCEDAAIEKVANEYVTTVPSGDVVILNETAHFILDSVDADGAERPDHIAQQLVERYGVSHKRADRDVRVCLARLRARGVLVPDYGSSTSGPGSSACALMSRRSFAGGVLAAAIGLIAPNRKAYAEESTAGGSSEEKDFGSWAEAFSPEAETRLWNDPRGFQVVLPAHIKKVAPVGAFSQSVLESIDPSLVVNATSWGLRASVSPDKRETASLLTDSVGEELCEYVVETEEPDIILSIAPTERRVLHNDALASNEAGVPVVHMVVGPDDLPAMYRTLAELLEAERANEVAEYVRDMNELLEWGRASVPPQVRKSVYVVRDGSCLTAFGSGTVVDKAISLAGGVNAAGEKEGFASNITLDEVARVFPSAVVCCPKGSGADPEEGSVLREAASQAEVFAASSNVFLEPTIPYGWIDCSPLLIYTLGAQWLACVLYPDLYEIDIEELASEFWSFMFGVELDPGDLGATQEKAEEALRDYLSSAETSPDQEISLGDDDSSGYDPPSVEGIALQSMLSSRSFMSSGGWSGGGITNNGFPSGGNGTVGGGASLGVGSSLADPEVVERKLSLIFRFQFGFDEDTSRILCRVIKSINAYALTIDDSKSMTAAYLFFRIMGSMVYGAEGRGGGLLDIDNDIEMMKAVVWDNTAGSIDDIYRRPGNDAGELIPLPYPELFFSETLHIPLKEYRKLRYCVRLQHSLCGSRRTEAETSFYDKKNNDNSTDYEEIKRDYEDAYSIPSLSDGAFAAKWIENISTMCIMPDFAHFCIVVATHLATSFGYGGGANTYLAFNYGNVIDVLGNIDAVRESFAGWLGDTGLTLFGDPSMGWDDYWADVDALHVVGLLLGNARHDIGEALASYFPASKAAIVRRQFFLLYFSADIASRAIAAGLDIRNVSSAQQLLSSIGDNPKLKDTQLFVELLLGYQKQIAYGSEV